MNGRVLIGVLLAIVLIVGAVCLGAYAYNVGVTAGLAQSGALQAPATGTAPYARPFYGPFFFRPFGWGFGILGLLFPLFFLFLIFGLLRAFIWGPRWRMHHHRYWAADERGVPPAVEEWHKRMHESQSAQK